MCSKVTIHDSHAHRWSWRWSANDLLVSGCGVFCSCSIYFILKLIQLCLVFTMAWWYILFTSSRQDPKPNTSFVSESVACFRFRNQSSRQCVCSWFLIACSSQKNGFYCNNFVPYVYPYWTMNITLYVYARLTIFQRQTGQHDGVFPVFPIPSDCTSNTARWLMENAGQEFFSYHVLWWVHAQFAHAAPTGSVWPSVSVRRPRSLKLTINGNLAFSGNYHGNNTP